MRQRLSRTRVLTIAITVPTAYRLREMAAFGIEHMPSGTSTAWWRH